MIKYNIGDKHGKLTIVSAAPPSEKYRNKRMVLCKCDCGNDISYPIWYLTNGIVTSCGCGKHEPRVDVRGERFGSLVAVEPTGEIYNHSAVWKWQCDCGNTVFATTESVKFGGRTGCGCTKSRSEIDNAAEARKNQALVDRTSLSSITRTKLFSNNTSGYRGVSFHKGRNKWVSRISFRGKHITIGYYDSKEDAYAARLRAEDALFLPVLEANASDYPKYLKKYLQSRE